MLANAFSKIFNTLHVPLSTPFITTSPHYKVTLTNTLVPPVPSFSYLLWVSIFTISPCSSEVWTKRKWRVNETLLNWYGFRGRRIFLSGRKKKARESRCLLNTRVRLVFYFQYFLYPCQFLYINTLLSYRVGFVLNKHFIGLVISYPILLEWILLKMVSC